MRGRKPSPSRTKALRGNPGRRKLSDSEPQFEVAIPPAPDHLDADALVEWNRITLELAAKQTISTVDMAILAIYCQSYSELRLLTVEAEGQSRYLLTDKGYKYKNPIHSDVRTARQELKSYLSELGITPTSRSKVKTVGKAKEDKPDQKIERLRAAFGAVKK